MPKGFNDKCSSFKIVAGTLGAPAPGEVWFFQGENYQGNCWAFPSVSYSFMNLYITLVSCFIAVLTTA